MARRGANYNTAAHGQMRTSVLAAGETIAEPSLAATCRCRGCGRLTPVALATDISDRIPARGDSGSVWACRECLATAVNRG